jgi:membrane associated rhomboid family serine protease
MQLEQYGLVPDRGVIGLIVALVVVSLVFYGGGAVVQQFFGEHLVLRPHDAIGWQPWQIVTYSFLDIQLKQILFTAITLLFFGNFVEQSLGARGFWKIFFAGAIGGGLVAGLLGRLIAPDTALLGSQGATTALLTAYAALMGNRRVNAYGLAMMNGALIAWIWVGISVVLIVADLFGPFWQTVLLQLFAVVGGGAAGWLVARRGGLDLGGSLDKMRMWRLKRRYRVLTGGRDSRDDKRWLN